MAFSQLSHGSQLRTITTKSETNSSVPSYCHGTPVKHPNDVNLDSEDDLHSSRPPSLSYGSSRTPSICSMTEPVASGPSHRSSSLRSQSPLNFVDAEGGNWFQEGHENNTHGRRTESPGPILHWAIPSHLRYPALSSATPAHNENVGSHGPQNLCSTAPSEHPLSVVQESSQSMCTTVLQDHIENPPSQVEYRDSTDNEVMKITSGRPGIDGEVTDSGSDSEDDTDDDIDSDDNNWSGSNDYVEAAIFQAAFPDHELAAYLITRMYGTLALGSSKKISRKVSSWQERITICANDSRTASTQTTSTQKAAAPNGSSSTPTVLGSKRDRVSGSADSNMGEEEDEEDDDNDESRRKRLKENPGDGPTIRFACPFYKMDPAKFDYQNNKEGSKPRRACRGPGFRTIQLLKEHLKRAHYPVQCDRCHLIFEGTDRTSAVKKLEEHRQLDEPCLKKQPSMREGISDAQWSSLSEGKQRGKQSRKGKAIAPETPKSNLQKWMDIWDILFPGQSPPKTPWYDTTPGDMTASYQFQGVHHFLDVFATAIENKLPAIRAAALSKTDEEFKNLLLNISQFGFQVWSTTVGWSDSSTSSLSNSRESDPLSSTSWEQISKETTTSQHQSPNMHSASVFRGAELGGQNCLSGTIRSSTGHGGINKNLENVLQSNQYPHQDISTSPQGTVPSTADFGLTAGFEASEFFPGNQYSNPLAGMQNPEWPTPMDQMQFHPDFDMTGTQSQGIPGVLPPQWGDHQYPPQNFGRYAGRP